MRLVPLLILFAMFLGSAGCAKQRSKVFGTVKQNGKPLAGATIMFMDEKDQTYMATCDKDGKYTMENVMRGKIKVGVQSAYDRPAAAADANPDDPNPPKKSGTPPVVNLKGSLDPKYNDPLQSGLTFDLKEPNQEYSVDLK